MLYAEIIQIIIYFNFSVTGSFQVVNDKTAALPVVSLPEAEPRAFELVLSYIYTDCIVPVKQGLLHTVLELLWPLKL